MPLGEIHGKIPSLQRTLYSSGDVVPENCFTIIISRACNLEDVLEAERKYVWNIAILMIPGQQYHCDCLEWCEDSFMLHLGTE